MKKLINKSLAIIIIILMSILCFSCAKTEKTDLWSDAIYSENKTFGSGAKTIELEVSAEDKSVTFTVNTDADTLENALTEHKLIEGEKGPYGLYVKKVNGITADYDIDKTFWSLCKDGTPLMTGVGDTEVKDGEHFEFIREKG